MAIYRLEVKSISRRDGRSATAAAAYRCASRIVDERTGEMHDYTRRRGVAHTEMLMPDSAPPAFRDRSEFWNAAEAAERRKDAKVAREFIMALPHELNHAGRVELSRSMARHLVERYGVGVDLAIHAPDRHGDQRNWHCHLLFSTRQVDADGMAAKTRQLDVRQTASIEVQHLREQWADFQNRSLDRAGFDERVDHRSNADRGIDKIPEPKLGPVATDMERAGRRSNAGDDVRRIRAENAALEAAIAQRQVIDLEIEREKRRVHQAKLERRDADAERFSVAATLEIQFGQQRADLEHKAADLQSRLDRQTRLQRFWFNLTGKNVRDRAELDQVQSSLRDVQRQHDEARAALQAEQQARHVAQTAQTRAERVRLVQPYIPANDADAAPAPPQRRAAGDFRNSAQPVPDSTLDDLFDRVNRIPGRERDIDFDI